MERTLSLVIRDGPSRSSTLGNLGSVNLMQAKPDEAQVYTPGAGRTARPRPLGEAGHVDQPGNVEYFRGRYGGGAQLFAEAMDYRASWTTAPARCARWSNLA